ncbi:6-phosphofructokinase [bacterium]|jgi:ATP-dependent phosphofructokinase / diphosphate-dependent phosphofructokinase|nr:6-phosphofructokinase [bacterium]
MKRIAILTAGGDTPALNATILGAVTRANQRKVEVLGLIKGFSSVFNPRLPHVHLNPLYASIPELDATRGGTMLGASRDYVDPNDKASHKLMMERFGKLSIDGLLCVGGDGTLNGMQPLADMLPTVLAPKTIDNDLGLNYLNEPDEWIREPAENPQGFNYVRSKRPRADFDIEQMVNYVTPGFATSVYVSASGVERIRTTAESHRRIAIIEVMGRHSGYLALASSYGQPDIVLIPEATLNIERLVDRVSELYELQKNVVIVCGEGIVDENGKELGAEKFSTDPAGNVTLSGAAEALRWILIERLGDDFFRRTRRAENAQAAVFTRKVGHTQRGGRPILFDRFHAAQLGGKALDMLIDGQHNSVAVLQWDRARGFHVEGLPANSFRDRWGHIHARFVHPSMYDAISLRPSATAINYLEPIFKTAIGYDDVECVREKLFDTGNLIRPFHSVNIDVNKRIRYID